MPPTPDTGRVLLVDKPAHMTSFGLVARLRRILGEKKAGHAGTLDPLATGLMLVGIGRGTKQLTALVKLDKEYTADILIGQKRTTGDMEGEVLEEKEVVDNFSTEKLSTTLAILLGTHTLPVSAYSAIRRDGVPMYKRAYEAAAKGEIIEDVPQRAMRIDEVELLQQQTILYDSNVHEWLVGERADDIKNASLYGSKKFQLVKVRFKVGSGTYIRSLAEELGRLLDYPATLYSLRRTQVGEFRIEDAVTLEQLSKEYGVELY